MSKSVLWTEESSVIKGLPRPHYYLPEKFLNRDDHRKIFKHKKFPIPWQSVPVFDREDLPSICNPNPGDLGLIVDREAQVYTDNLCGFCGVKFLDTDTCIRWTSIKGMHGVRIRSDHLPLHEKCMKQARTFCPFMQNTEDFEFERGTYKDLKLNAEPDIQAISQQAGYR
jgi:hypothetical protein